MSIGNNPTDFRMYVTADGGRTWAITFVNTEPTAFYDCMSFFNRKDGLAVSDPPDGVHFRVLATNDGGLSWHITGLQMPAAPGEYGFAASGECLTTDHGHRAWFGSGGAAARVFRSDDRGVTLDRLADAHRVRPHRRDQRPGLQRPAARPRRRRRLRGTDGVAQQLRPHVRRRPELGPPPIRTLRVPLRRDLGRRPHRDRRRALRQRREHGLRRELAALRRRQPRHGRLREPSRLLGLRRGRPGRDLASPR